MIYGAGLERRRARNSVQLGGRRVIHFPRGRGAGRAGGRLLHDLRYSRRAGRRRLDPAPVSSSSPEISRNLRRVHDPEPSPNPSPSKPIL